jgi:hypothetical protein
MYARRQYLKFKFAVKTPIRVGVDSEFEVTAHKEEEDF